MAPEDRINAREKSRRKNSVLSRSIMSGDDGNVIMSSETAEASRTDQEEFGDLTAEALRTPSRESEGICSKTLDKPLRPIYLCGEKRTTQLSILKTGRKLKSSLKPSRGV
jgi:hypothetical protein